MVFIPFYLLELFSYITSSTIGCLQVLFCFLLIGLFIYWGKEQAIWLFSGYLFLTAWALFTITQTFYSASIRPSYYAYLTISYSLLALTFGSLFSYLGFGATGVIFGIALGIFIPAIYVFNKIWLPFKPSEYQPRLFKRLYVYGMPLAAAALVEEITKVSDRFMLAGMKSKSDAGLLDSDGVKAATEYFKHYVILLMAIAIPAVVGLNLVGPNLVYLLIDADYQKSVIFLLPWITIAIFLMGLQVFYFDLAFQLGQKTIASVKIAVVIAIINVGLNYKLIPGYGIQGAAIATISSFAVGCILSAYYGKKHFSLPFPISDIFKILISTFIMFISLYLFKDYTGWGWLLIQLTIGLASYLIVSLILNVLEIRDNLTNYIKLIFS